MTRAERGRHAGARGRAGFALQAVLVLLLAATVLVTTMAAMTVAEERAAGAAGRGTRLAGAADAVLAEMEAHLLARVEATAGALEDEDLAALQGEVADLRAPAPDVTVDPDGTAWRAVEVRDGERIPHDEVPLAAWSDQPRLGPAGIPPVGGLVAARTVVVALVATVRDRAGGVARVRRDLAVSRVPPHQHALYVAGDAALCASATPRSTIGGPVRVDGTLRAPACAHLLRVAGGIEGRDGIEAGTTSPVLVVGDGGERPLAALSRDDATRDPAGALAPWGGRVRVGAALGGALASTRLSGPAVAGAGECDEVPAMGSPGCGGGAAYLPSVQLQRVTPGGGPEYDARCGAAYPAGCGAVRGAVTYHPWPFLAGPPAGAAAEDPANPPLPWRGLLPDARREARCTATVGGVTYRTFRCATNAYGFRVDLSRLPALAGGLLSFRRAAGLSPDANPSGAQEVVLLVHAAALAGPLTIHADMPVYVAGSFNVTARPGYGGPPPAMIHAPRIVVLPNEATRQLETSAVWDSVAPAGGGAPRAEPLRAESEVTIHAVLRAGACGTQGGRFFGGAWEGVPAVLGDWGAAGLRVVGAVEARMETPSAEACGAWAGPLDGVPASGTATVQPAWRTLLFDERLLRAGFQPPGSWRAENLPAGGVAGRPAARQSRATGGTVVVRRVRDARRGMAPLPEPVPVPRTGSPAAAPSLPP